MTATTLTAPLPTRSLLRYAADRRTLGFVAAYFGVLAFAFIVRPAGWPARIALAVTLSQLSFFCAVITHNTLHAPIFHRRWLNKVFQVVLSLAYGHPVSAYVPGHNLSHHKWTQTRKDVMRTSKLHFRVNLFNQVFFLSRVSTAILRAEFGYARAMRKAKPTWFRQLIIEAAIYLAAQGALIAIDWRSFLLYGLLPHQFCAWGIVGINFVQHDGCDENHPYNHSRNVVGRLVNWFTFNNGFHGIHHVEPGLHWSRLPTEHERQLHPFIHPNLEQRSLLRYLVSAYIWPGRRVTYDGKPYTPPEAGEDEDWMSAAAFDNPAGVSLGVET